MFPLQNQLRGAFFIKNKRALFKNVTGFRLIIFRKFNFPQTTGTNCLVPVKMKKDPLPLSPILFSVDLVSKIRFKTILKNLHKRNREKNKKNITKTDFFGLWSDPFMKVFHGVFTVDSRGQVY